MKVIYILFIITALFYTVNEAHICDRFILDPDIELSLNYMRSKHNLSDKNYCDSIGITKMFKLDEGEFKHKEIIQRYLDKLPHNDIQKELIEKYNINPRIVILINFQEGNFEEVYNNGDLNFRKFGVTSKDWGSMQMNGRWFPRAKEAIKDGDYYKYYEIAYKRLINIKNDDMKIWFMNWHNPTVDEHRNNYYNDFLLRTNKNNKDLRVLMYD